VLNLRSLLLCVFCCSLSCASRLQSPAPAAETPLTSAAGATSARSVRGDTPAINIHDGGHRPLPCTRCHSNDGEGRVTSFAGGSGDCVSCHRADDEHNGAFGERCAMCHDAGRWKNVRTGHDITPQPLAGAHDRVPCQSCHVGGRPLRGQGSQCISCHQRDDIHHHSLGPRCADCHTQQSFAPARFNHDTVGCSLRGVHRVLPCVDCHKGGNYAGLSPLCISCHRDDAMRAAANNIQPLQHQQHSACTPCHNPVSFRGVGIRQGPPESVCQ
jgi:hypothetical protein